MARPSVPQNVTSNVSLTTRIKVWLQSLTLTTKFIFLTCVVIYLVEVLFVSRRWYMTFDVLLRIVFLSLVFFANWILHILVFNSKIKFLDYHFHLFEKGLGSISGDVCLNPRAIGHGQIYRLITSMLFHGGVLHILMNMMAFLPMGVTMERSIGSLQFFHVICLFGVVGSLIYVSIAYAALYLFRYSDFYASCSVGFSGVLFGLLVVESVGGVGSRSIFGFFKVPAHLYPWALLIVIQLIMPNVSFLGHLSGILVGYMYVYRVGLNYLLLPTWLMNRIEASRPFGFVLRLDGYITNPSLGSASIQAGQAALSRSSILPIVNPTTSTNVSHFTPTVATLGTRNSPNQTHSTNSNNSHNSHHQAMSPASHFTPTIATHSSPNSNRTTPNSNNNSTHNSSNNTSNNSHHSLDMSGLHQNGTHKPSSSPKPPSSN